jgi:hypothetical protein
VRHAHRCTRIFGVHGAPYKLHPVVHFSRVNTLLEVSQASGSRVRQFSLKGLAFGSSRSGDWILVIGFW